MNRRTLFLTPLALALPFLFTGRARAHGFQLGGIDIAHPWAKPSATDVAAVFMVLTNNGEKPDRLIAGSTPVAGEVIFRDRGGEPLEYYDLRPKRPVNLRPGARYIALRNLKRPLAIDDRFPLTLRFQQAGAITVEILVEAGPEEP